MTSFRYKMGTFQPVSSIIIFSIIVIMLPSALSFMGLDSVTACGFTPSKVLDVGANKGDWSRSVHSLWPSASIFMVEGNDVHEEKLRKSEFPYEIALVGDKARTVQFYRSDNDPGGTGNSIYKENSEYFSKGYYVNRSLTTIDEIVSRRGLGKINMLKLDIQGAEVDALKGASRTLMEVEVVLTEVAIVSYNAGAPSFLTLHQLMDSRGFALYDIPDLSREQKSHYKVDTNNSNEKRQKNKRRKREGRLLQLDVLWVRKTSTLWSSECTGYPVPSYFADKTII